MEDPKIPFAVLVSQQPARGSKVRQMFRTAHSWMGSAVGLVLKLEVIWCRMGGRRQNKHRKRNSTAAQLKICRNAKNFGANILFIKKRLLT